MNFRISPFAILIILLLSFAACDIFNGNDPDPGEIELVSRVDIVGDFVTDVWEYRDIERGQTYAIIGDFSRILQSDVGNTVTLVNVTDPQNPEITSTINEVDGFDMKVFQQFLYVANGGSDFTITKQGSSTIYDLSDPTNPVQVGLFTPAHNIFIDEKGFLYAEGVNDDEGLTIFDLNPDPTNPVQVWQDETGKEGHDVSVIRNRIYDFHGDFTRIYDGTDPANPQLLGEITGDDIFHHSGWVTEDDNFLFISDEAKRERGADITIWDINNPANPQLVGNITDVENRSHNIYIINNLAYVSYYGAGLRTYDISQPTSPRKLDEFDTAMDDEGLGSGFNGSFGVFPFTGSEIVYVSDIDNGLYLFRVENN